MKTSIKPKRVIALVAGIGALLLLAGCAAPSSAQSDEKVTLRFSWWGSDVRHALTQEVIDAFEAENPNITIEGEFGDFNSYWDKLATQVAANDAPDIIQMDSGYIREYAGRGALLDLSTQEIDTSGIEKSVLGTGAFDGGLYGIINGINLPVLLANPALFAQAGVELPDDTTWTWDDYKDIATRITAGSPDGVYGSESYGNDPTTMEMWMRQHGKSLFTDDGGLGFKARDAAGYWEFLTKLRDSGAIPPASLVEENAAATLDERQNATGAAALGWWVSNQLPAAEAALGSELKILRYPSITGNAEDAEQYFRASQLWTVSSRTEHPAEAARFVDFLANSKVAAGIMLTERGVIPNEELREALAPKLTETDQIMSNFVSEVEGELGSAVAPTPVGLGGMGFPMSRHSSEVLFDRLTPAQAGAGLLTEAKANLRE